MNGVVVVLIAGLLAIWTWVPGSTAAQQADKQRAGSFEHVHALVADAAGGTLWLGAHTGLFRSEDRGLTWKPVPLSSTHGHLDVMALLSDPGHAKTLYVATHEAGVFKTRNGGASWAAVNRGLGGLDVHGLALDPRGAHKLHAAVRGPGEGVYRTTDGGEKWVRVDDGPSGEVKVLASVNIPTGMGGIFLYAGTSQGLLRSPDCF
jgi:photosystem II stability/assembly factor-like uncharacterized protein